jgi:hypothetical protein
VSSEQIENYNLFAKKDTIISTGSKFKFNILNYVVLSGTGLMFAFIQWSAALIRIRITASYQPLGH